MNNVSVTLPARLFTSFGTILYVDPATGQLRHGQLARKQPGERRIRCGLGLRRFGVWVGSRYCWGFRLFDLGAIAASRLNLTDLAVEWGHKALELASDDQRQRLESNLSFFVSHRKEVRLAL
jgi:hypothetical protein